MSENISVLTNDAQALTDATVNAFNSVVLSHIYGDFSAHTQVRVFPVPFYEDVSGHKITDYTLRILLTHPVYGEIAVALPCEPTSTLVSTDGPPVFVGQPDPSFQSVPTGGTAQFTVFVASTTAAHYQWQKNGTDIFGATAPLLYLSAVTSADTAFYRCVATNTFGPTISANGTLVVT